MKHKLFILAMAITLTACATKPTEAPVCSGNTLRGCQPVVYFDIGSYKIKWDQVETLNWAYNKMKRFPREHVMVTGYTDWDGSFVLSKRRAMAIKQYFVERGIEPNRILTAFQREFSPVCTSNDCRHLNRRAELKLFKPNGGWKWADNAESDI